MYFHCVAYVLRSIANKQTAEICPNASCRQLSTARSAAPSSCSRNSSGAASAFKAQALALEKSLGERSEHSRFSATIASGWSSKRPVEATRCARSRATWATSPGDSPDSPYILYYII